MAGLLERRYVISRKVTIVLDNLNTHTKGVFYAALGPERARALVP